MNNNNYELDETEIYNSNGETVFDIENLSNEEIIKILEVTNEQITDK